ncbi:dienelactone hydrolase [Bradyrhizobium sp. LM2.9]
MRLPLTALFLTFLISAAQASPAPQQVEIPLASGVLHAQLYKPEGTGPFPAVIALHGCGGLGGHSDSVLSRYRDWAERLLKSGNAVLLPDSYGSRELGPQCRVKEMHVKARRERVADIAASRAWLMKQSWVVRDRVSLMGWANGASALLWAVRPQGAARDAGPDFRAAIAFYPDCRISAGLGWSTRVPTLVLIGANDDSCRRRRPAARWSRARMGAARSHASWSIPAPITISTAPTRRCTPLPAAPTPPHPSTVISAPMR